MNQLEQFLNEDLLLFGSPIKDPSECFLLFTKDFGHIEATNSVSEAIRYALQNTDEGFVYVVYPENFVRNPEKENFYKPIDRFATPYLTRIKVTQDSI